MLLTQLLKLEILVYSDVATGDLLTLSGQFPTPTPRSGAGQAQSVTKWTEAHETQDKDSMGGSGGVREEEDTIKWRDKRDKNHYIHI